MATDVLIIGAGVSGLSTGVQLLQAGRAVEIVAAERTPHTTSDVAAAVFFPYEAQPRERVLQWSLRSLEAFTRLIEEGEAPVSWIEMALLPGAGEEPWWRECVLDFQETDAGFVFRVPLIDMSRYMPWLEERFRRLGGCIREGRVERLAEDAAGRSAVVNCAGLGSSTFLEDADLFPIRGQVVRVANPGGIERCRVDEDGPLGMRYVIPRRDDVVLGGTADVGSWDTRPDAATEAAILEGCRALEPALDGAPVLGRAVGLRPGRSEVRLEMHIPEGMDCVVVHNYGHGGAGVTLSWGCAQDVAELLDCVL